MKAIIPVAGIGTRLRPHTYTQPKVLINVGGKPIIGHILDKIISDGFTEATIVVGHLGDMIRDYIVTNYKIKTNFVNQDEQRGLAHAVSIAMDMHKPEPTLIILGDTIFDVDLKPVLRGEFSSIGVKSVEDPRRFGVVEINDGFVTNLVEKPENPKTNLAIVGLYWIKNMSLLHECISDLMKLDKKTKGEYQLTDALQLMVNRGEKITTFQVEGWYDCGKPETILSTNRVLLERKSHYSEKKGVCFEPPIFVEDNVNIRNSIIGPYVTISKGVKISNSIIKNSIIGEETIVENIIIENSLIGNRAVIQGSVKKINIGDSSEFHS